jgi:protein-S-isoprenylcysteine O-methyltransferase Ste14
MNDQIAAAAPSILSDSLSYLITMILIQVFVVFRMFLRGGGDHTVRERFMASVPLQFVVVVVVMIMFVFSRLEDMLLVGHVRPWWGLYLSTLGITGAAGRAFMVWNYVPESRRPSSIADTSEETASRQAANHSGTKGIRCVDSRCDTSSRVAG